MDTMREERIKEGMMRSRIYRLLSSAYLYHNEESLSNLCKEVKVILATLNGEGSLRDAFKSFASSIESLTFEEFKAENRRFFGHVVSKEFSPYETEYGSSHIFQQTERMGDIASFYRAFGMEVSENAKERVDHISVELEFMHLLSYKEAFALEHHGPEKALICRDAERKFIQDHLGRWTPVFLDFHSRQSGFYFHLSNLMKEFLKRERTDFGIESGEMLTPLQKNRPILEEEGKEDFCGIP